MTKGEEDEDMIATAYYLWVTDSDGKLRLQAFSAADSSAIPENLDDVVVIKFKKEYGEGNTSVGFEFMKRFMGDGTGGQTSTDANGENDPSWTAPSFVQRRAITGTKSDQPGGLDGFVLKGDFNGTSNQVDTAHKVYLNCATKDSSSRLADQIVKDTDSEGKVSISGTFVQNNVAETYMREVTKLAPGDGKYTWQPSSDPNKEFIPETFAAKDLGNDKAWGGMIVFNEKVTKTTTTIDDSMISRIESVSGDFIGNYNNSAYYKARGGLIYNGFLGYIGEISGNFIGNNIGVKDTSYTKAKTNNAARTSHGGVIYNHNNGTIGYITGNFISNGIWLDVTDENLTHATLSDNNVRVDVIGGVLVNHGTIEQGIDIVAIGNYAYAATTANSGVMRNYSGPGYIGIIGAGDDGVSINGVYIGNFARGVTGDAYGGIMRNNGSVQGTIKGYYYGNYASADGNYTVSHYTYTVDKENYGEGHYKYDLDEEGQNVDIEDAPYISYEEAVQRAIETGESVNKEDFYLKRGLAKRYHTGERSGQAQGGVYYNTIKNDGTGSTAAELSNIDATFVSNYAMSKWGEATGGVLYNQDATIEFISGTFTDNYALSMAHMARGGAIYNKLQLKDKATIQDIGTKETPVEFTGNYAQGRIAGGGAIYSSSYSEIGEIYANFRYNHAESTLALNESDMEKYESKEAHFVYDKLTPEEQEYCEDYYQYRARGGAIFVDNYAVVGNMHVDEFTGNYVESAELGAKVRGGAILVTTGAVIGHIGGYDRDYALFKGNYAYGAHHNELETFGGAIRFDNSVINELSANFDYNWTTGSGGALSLTESGFIFKITGSFTGNQAGHLGGAVHNLGTIGYLGQIAIRNEQGEIEYVDQLDELQEYESAVRGENNRILTRSDETARRNKSGFYEYDGSIRGGFINTSFIDNKVDNVSIKVVGTKGKYELWNGTGDYDEKYTRDGERGFGGAIYTTDHLFITADMPTADGILRIANNEVAYIGDVGEMEPDKDHVKHLSTALYVDSKDRSADDLIAIYLVSTSGSRMEIKDAIRGTEGRTFVLRMRGYSEKYDYEAVNRGEKSYLGGGTIYLSGPVAQSYAIMDDVTLEIDRCVNYFSFGDEDKGDKGDKVYKTYLPGYIEDEDQDAYGRSDVFRKSHLSVRSGTVDLSAGDKGQITQFIFGSLISSGFTWRYNENGTNDLSIAEFYENNDLYGKWVVDIQGSGDPTKSGEMGKADLITVISDIDAKGNFVVGTNKSEGRITLKDINIKYGPDLDQGYDFEKDVKGDDLQYPLKKEYTFKAQILNIVLQRDGEILTDDEYADTKYLTSASPLQLDNELNRVDWEHSVMKSSEVLAKNIRLATTRTYHDSIEIIGWRDNLAAWAEMTTDMAAPRITDDADSRYDESGAYWDAGTFDLQKKEFILDSGYHELTRNVCNLNNHENKWEVSNGAVWGLDWTILGLNQSNVLNLNGLNLLSIVEADQQGRLQNFTLTKVQGGKILNEGLLTLDTMLADALIVDNQNTVTLQGHMVIDKSITITTEAPAVATIAAEEYPWKKMYINDETRVFTNQEAEKTVLNITVGTIEKQDIIHQGTTLQSPEALEEEATIELTQKLLEDNNFSTVTNLYTTDASGNVTEGFRNFQQNSLTMEGGKLNLGNMISEVLYLRGLHMRGGLIHVSSSTVDLAKEKMGGIRGIENGKDNASYAGGVIWLNNIKLVSDGGYVTHVQFVTSDAGDAVKDNKIRNTYMWGPKYQYWVTYNDQERLDDKGNPGQNGYYTFSRTDRRNPMLFAEPVAGLTGGFAQMTTIYDYAFEHADLFSATMENSRRPLDDTPVVVPVKGAAPEATPTTTCPTNLAGMRSGLWLRPYASSEKMDLHNGPRVNSTTYGALVGGDTGLTELSGGWGAVTSAYGAYMGARQTYDGNRTTQNGLGVGLTETFYRGKFYTAVTASAAISDVRTNSMYGIEDYSLLMAGIASRTGYSMNLGSCRYVLQPTLLMSYTFISASDYTNAAGVRMESDPLHVIQLHPYLKAVMHSDSGWNPYITAGYVHNFMGKTSYRADGDKLPELSIDPYVEYGVGLQKTWNDRYTLYGQVTGRNGGREGAEVSVGVRLVW